jgi:hypothetical protein
VQSRKVLIFGGIVVGMLAIVVGGLIFVNAQRATAGGSNFPTAAQAALTQTVDGMRIPGVAVSPDWHITSTQLAPSPAKLPSQPLNLGQIKSMYCVVISPPVSEQSTSVIFLSHFLVVQSTVNSASQWIAFTVDSTQADQGKNTFLAIGCTNG